MKLTLPYVSQSSPHSKPHVATFDTDSRTATCTCRGFRSPARCWHSRDIAEQYARGALSTTVLPFVPPSVNSPRIEPMLASAMTKGQVLADYATPEWIGEEKFDGDRQLTTVQHGQVVESRSRAGKTRTLPKDVCEVLASLPDGIYDLEDMATRKTLGGDRDGRRVVLFDVVEVMGTRVTDKSLLERRALLEVAYAHITKRVLKQTVVCLSTQWPVTQAAVDAILARGGEGAILKRLASTYQSRARSADWIKVKREGAVTVTILGFEDGEHRLGITRVVDAAGREFTVRTGAGNQMILRDVQSAPAKYIDRRLVLEYTEQLESGAYRHPRWDHLASVTE